MTQCWQTVIYAVNLVIAASTPQSGRPSIVATTPFEAKFVRSTMGREVRICIDGRKVERTFAGKMLFRDNGGVWISVCANVRAPVAAGQTFVVQGVKTTKVGGNIQKAGNIVAKYFNEAQTPDECAALQIAVWKAIEDGDDPLDFGSGHFQVQANQQVMSIAAMYYQAIGTPGQAALATTLGKTGQSQLTPVATTQ